MAESPLLISGQELLALHAARDGRQLWRFCDALLRKCFTNHFIAGAFQFVVERPLVVLRSESAPKQNAKWWNRNVAAHPMLDMIVENPALRFTRVTDVLPAEKIKELDYYREFMVPEGWLYSVGIFFRLEGRVIGLLGINRTEAQGDFTEKEMERVEALYPHLEVAFRRVAMTQAERAGAVSFGRLLANLPLPTALVSWQGRPVYLNNRARELCLQWKSGSRPGTATSNLSAARVPAEILRACEILRGTAHDVCPTNANTLSPDAI